MNEKFNLQDLEVCSPEELLEELQYLVEDYQTNQELNESIPASKADIGSCLFFCWSILKVLMNSKREEDGVD